MVLEKKTCPVCNREIDARGMSGHMRTHKTEVKGANDGVISYPSNEQKETVEKEMVPPGTEEPGNTKQPSTTQAEQETVTGKPAKKPVASKPASKSASNPASKLEGRDTRGARKTDTEMKTEYRGLFR